MIDIKILEQIIDVELFEKIKDYYVSGDYRMLITKSVDYFRDLLREKSEEYNLDGDKLIAACFNKKQNPKLIIGDLNTETGISKQSGIENLAYGIHRYIRNPQFHGHYLKVEEILEALIIISFVIKKIKSSETKYSKIKFLNELKDPHFDLSEKYVNLILSEVPQDILLDCLIFTIDYVQNNEIYYRVYELVFAWYVKNNIDLNIFYSNISLILETNKNEEIILKWLYILKDKIIYLTGKAKLRSESVFIKKLYYITTEYSNSKSSNNDIHGLVIYILNNMFYSLDENNYLKIKRLAFKFMANNYIPTYFYNTISKLILFSIIKLDKYPDDIESFFDFNIFYDEDNILFYINDLIFKNINYAFKDNLISCMKYALNNLDAIICYGIRLYKDANNVNETDLKLCFKSIIEYYINNLNTENQDDIVPF